ncbi:STAS domain-containing protein [Geomonas paludis]|uniref:STAS domain-containing protein n=1 Tax=Geomonas paludis TaxID=2740185 RepID=A0A6V8MZP6_9BACT|nr:STAS domain-containing protein [Geomonas paludis]UPU34735.1 STAS domain-containing protein [Geomonas paludis]GFO65107.1 sulfate transporter [Geomonas paludis]
MEAAQVKVSRKKERTVVTLSGEMIIANVGELRQRLLQAFAAGKPVELCVAGVTGIDVTGLQLLCSCHRTSVDRGIPCTVTGHNEALAAIAEVAGMPRLKGCVTDVDGTCFWRTDTDMVTL